MSYKAAIEAMKQAIQENGKPNCSVKQFIEFFDVPKRRREDAQREIEAYLKTIKAR